MSIFPCHYSCYPLSRTSLPPPSYRLGNLAFQHVYKADYCSLLKSLVSCEQVISTKRGANPCAYSDCDLVHRFRFLSFLLNPFLSSITIWWKQFPHRLLLTPLFTLWTTLSNPRSTVSLQRELDTASNVDGLAIWRSGTSVLQRRDCLSSLNRNVLVKKKLDCCRVGSFSFRRRSMRRSKAKEQSKGAGPFGGNSLALEWHFSFSQSPNTSIDFLYSKFSQSV